MGEIQKSNGQKVLQAMAEAYPQPTHFGYLGLVLGLSPGAMLRALRYLVARDMVHVERSRHDDGIPWSKARITDKGRAVAAGLSGSYEEVMAALDRLEGAALHQLRHPRAKPARAAVVPPAMAPHAGSPSARPTAAGPAKPHTAHRFGH